VFAESIAKLIYQVPVIRQEIASITTGNEQRKEEEKVVSTGFCEWPISC
jgi:hypothetical protein